MYQYGYEGNRNHSSEFRILNIPCMGCNDGIRYQLYFMVVNVINVLKMTMEQSILMCIHFSYFQRKTKDINLR